MLNEFLNSNPEYYNAIRDSVTAGVERGLLSTKEVFGTVVDSEKFKDVEQKGNRFPYLGKGGLLKPKFVKTFTGKDYVKSQEAQLDSFLDFFKGVEKYLNKNPQDAWYFDAVVKDAQDNQNSIFRYSAPILFLNVDKNGKYPLNVPMREEHSTPQNRIGSMLLDAAIKGNVNQVSKLVKAIYMQGGVTRVDDALLDVNYKFGMPDFFWENVAPRIISGELKLDNGLGAIIRMTEAGANLDNYQYIVANKTFSEYFFGKKGLQQSVQAELIRDYFSGKKTAEQIKEYAKFEDKLSSDKVKSSKRMNDLMPSEIKYSKTISLQTAVNALAKSDKALNNARKPDAPIKKIRVFDFDDTLARSKSKVLYTVPNAEGGFSEGATKLKAIFMVGGPGAGKTNVGKGLQLGRRGYKVVNQDIALEAMKEEAGLPAKESDYTAEQRSLRSKLGAAARKAAVAKFDKYAATGNGMVIDGTGASYNATTKKIKALEDQGFEVHMVVATTPLETAIARNKARTERSLPDFVVKKTYDQVQESLAKYRKDFGGRLYEINTETIEYGKPLPTEFLKQVYAGINTNKVGKVDATSFAENYDVLESQGAEFDFREFSKVIEGKKGPLFSVAKKIAAARGTDDVFILTARPADAAKPIQEFMKANGIDIPLANITGLGDGTAEAKAGWIMGKAAEGYNDFYFADDAVKNVQAVKDVLSKADVKSKIQQAKVKFSKRLGKDLAKNKNYTKFRDGLKGSVLYHGGTASLSSNKAVWFTVDDFDGAEIYAERKDGKVYSIDSNNLKNAIIIPDVADLVGLDNVIKNKHKSVADQVFDEYGQVDIKKVLETDSASEIISDIINYVDNNFELADGVYGPETLYDNSGKISKGTPVIVIGGNVSTKVTKVEVPKSMRTIPAVSNVLSQVDIKSKVQQAKASKRIVFDKVFNDIIEQKTGIESYKQFSAAKAKTVGSSKGRFTFFTTPSAEDFLGLLYKTLGKGKVGDAQMAFYKTNLLDPYNRAEIAISQAKVAAGRDYKALKKQFKNIPKTLEKETGIAKYTYQHAIRTYIWNKQGIEVPGLSKRDQKRLTDFIANDAELSVFADNLITIQKDKPYPSPSKDWTAGTITTDVIGGINKVNRKEYLQEWQENVDIIFSDKNMNKLEAAFGAKYVEALKDSLRSMKSGSNRPLGGDRVSDGILDWLNNSVGAIMFLNTRSAVLQTISAVNFVNWGDNNILKAGKAFANQKQFWGDFLTLMNSDYLLERRDGLKINVSESEIADAVQGSKNKVNAAISFLLNKGFVFTRYADSFAIASGGATFYRNRIEALVEQGMDRKAAEEQAFNDFRAIAEENQQSSSPSKISQQQRSLIGRIILQFGNTQLQYVRIQKRAVQDLVNKRGDWKSNVSKIVYYGAIQNLMFNALQSGLAWALFDDDEEDEKLTEKNKEQKLQRTLNGAIDSQLKGLGIQGAVVSGIKNALITIAEQADKKSPKFEEALDDLLSTAPALGSKIRKLKSAARTVSWNRKEIKEEGFSMDNPAYLAGAQVISAAFNIPLDRAVMKMNNMRNILNPATENWQKVALALGWSGWDVGLPYFGLAEDKPVLTETEKQTQKLFDLNKSDQVKKLLDLGLTKKEIRALTKEEDRVKEIIKLQNKKKDDK